MMTGLVAYHMKEEKEYNPYDIMQEKDIPDTFNSEEKEDDKVWKGNELGQNEPDDFPVEEEDSSVKEDDSNFKMPRSMAVYCDAETLLEDVMVDNRPNQKVINAIKTLHSSGNAVYLWSQAGWEYCVEIAEKFKLGDIIECYLDKPNIFIDNFGYDDYIYADVNASNINEIFEPKKIEEDKK